ncbi:MAG: NfeD family protein [Thermoplasmata archaeon]
MVSFDFTLGLTFVIVGIVLLLIEASSPGFFIGVPATILIVLGLLGMYIPNFFLQPWAPITAIVVGVPLTYVTILLYQRLAPPSPPTTTVGESLIGRTGLVIREVVPDSIEGKVNIDNQVWSATSADAIAEGTRVRVVGSSGVHVILEPVNEAKAEEIESEKEKKETG